ncbi:MAG TPA: DeoR/GlpR family DNA-binding transcription regulator [Chloroflexota bacterium]|nr:DeoR/GlpR family DNA-binding transcription regulator [Chloroflexota bacterium]
MTAERRLALIDLLEEQDVFAVDDLARRFNVSTQTIRRDLRAMETQGLLRRTYGGAVTRGATHSLEHTFFSRAEERRSEKEAIALAALPLLSPGQTIMFDASSTVLHLARHLPPDFEATAVINSLPIGLELGKRPRLNVTFLGGTMRHTSLSFAGPLAEATMHRLFVDCAVLSARGCSASHGLTEANPYEARLKELIVANAARVIAVVDSSKLGRAALMHFAPLDRVDTLVTDYDADPLILDSLRAHGMTIVVAEPLEPNAKTGLERTMIHEFGG